MVQEVITGFDTTFEQGESRSVVGLETQFVELTVVGQTALGRWFVGLADSGHQTGLVS